MTSIELVSFETSLRKVNKILRISGLQIDEEETNQTTIERAWHRKFFLFWHVLLYAELVGEIEWMVVNGFMSGNLLEIIYITPCVTFCLLGSVKSYFRLKNGHHINNLIYSLRRLQSPLFDSGIHTNPTAYEEIRNIVRKLHTSIKVLSVFNAFGVIAFLLGPLFVLALMYATTGKVELRYPFPILYPFDVYDLRVYPFIYIYQMFVGVYTVNTIFGPDCLYYTFCSFVQAHFVSLQYDLESIITPSSSLRLQTTNDAYESKFTACVGRHRELIRCCDMIEAVFSKSALFNFMSSSLLLCMAGFNIVAYDDFVQFCNFLSFLSICLIQIYLICDYGDKLSRASMDLSNAVYNCQWYNVDAKSARDLLMILTRAQKPCKLTAYTFTEINLGAFSRILSTSWSYFALLQSVYSRDNGH